MKKQFPYFEDKGVKPAYLNLEDDVDTIAVTLPGADVIVFTAGSGGSTGPAMSPQFQPDMRHLVFHVEMLRM